jgi:endonuclease/exonuclease/phosphatase family metal-dependent hydrolase
LEPATAVQPPSEPGAPPYAPETITVCSFNIQFLGSSKERDDEAMASVVRDYDVVVVQELVAPPYPITFSDGTSAKPDPQAAEFFDAMKANGFTYWLSEEDTGTGAAIHSNGTNTEWWVTFYKPGKVGKAEDLPHGFLADDRSDNPDYERVPYAVSLRTEDSRMDFVLISVHLQPGAAAKDKARRRHELSTIAAWVDAHDDKEKDFIILGDCNIENAAELREDTPPGFLSLNDECRPTNTNVNGPKPYDHVFYRPGLTIEMDREFDMAVIDLVQAVKPLWKGPGTFPGDPYVHDEFRKVYSDHNPVVFRLKVGEKDDD